MNHSFASLLTNARAADRAHERHARNGKRSRSGDHRHDIGFRLTIVGKNLRDHIDFVIETFWEQRADGTVDQAAGQRFLFSRAAFPLEQAARHAYRTEERRVGKEWLSTGKTRW